MPSKHFIRGFIIGSIILFSIILLLLIPMLAKAETNEGIRLTSSSGILELSFWENPDQLSIGLLHIHLSEKVNPNDNYMLVIKTMFSEHAFPMVEYPFGDDQQELACELEPDAVRSLVTDLKLDPKEIKISLQSEVTYTQVWIGDPKDIKPWR